MKPKEVMTSDNIVLSRVSAHSQVSTHPPIFGLVSVSPGERNHRILREACCSSETKRYRMRSCQFVLDRINRVIDHAISGAQSSTIECEIMTRGKKKTSACVTSRRTFHPGASMYRVSAHTQFWQRAHPRYLLRLSLPAYVFFAALCE